MEKHGIISWSDCLIGVLVIFLFCVTLLLNILALHYTYSKIRKPSNKKIPHLLVGALSLGGLGIALFEYPPFIASRFQGEWLNDSGVCSFVAFIIVLFGNLTICLVVLMSLERLGAIVFPFYYKEHVNFRKAVVVLVLVIIYSILLASLPLFLDRIQLNVSTGVCTYAVDTHNTNTRIIVAVMVAHYIASIILMFVSNMVVVRTVSKLDKNTMSDEYSSRCGERKHGNNACLNFAKMVGVLAFCYTICWTVILMRILLRYAYGWRNYYYDQVVVVLTTFDPLINHCVCLWIMRKYRDGYVNSMGSLVSCFKISDDGIWATTITRLSTMSRRSTYSRASTRSSSRQPSKPYVYKQVPQNMEGNHQPDLLPELEDEHGQSPGLKPEHEVRTSEKRGPEKRIYSDTNKDWSDLIRELNAEKNDKSSPRVSSDFQGNKFEPIIEAPQEETSREYKTKAKWLEIIAKHKAQDQRDSEKRNVGIPEERSADIDVTSGGSLQTAAQQSAMNKKANLPELLQGIQVEKASVRPELLGYGAPEMSRNANVSPIPELLQDIGSNHDGTRKTDAESQNKSSSVAKDESSGQPTAQQDEAEHVQQGDQDQDKGDESKD